METIIEGCKSIVPCEGKEDVITWIAHPKGQFIVLSAWNVFGRKAAVNTWHRLICSSPSISRHCFISWLAAGNKLKTLDTVAEWKGGVDITCVYCHGAVDSRDHLYFDCAFSTSIWKTVLHKLGERRIPRVWSFELQRASIKYKGKSLRAAIARSAWHACKYHIWKARNGNIFEGIALSESKVVECIKQDVECRLMGTKGLHQKVRNGC
ncbi:hypothetical protein CRG98_046871 [Punica granatum]|uniref:Reverse transcriptase zinc-binding domain-containing protein n=1 Tax=Punica granatum TaxID=22663 RepID=A0A2I0HLZ2_PUNGR|nr:hypothetical protein CRG98_046871 [Punica granatum]